MPTALIVEDEPETNKLLAMLLQLRGYKTLSAYTGSEALECVRNHLPDIVFLDLMLPDINGYEVCQTLKSFKPSSLIPLIIVTARLAAENRIESFCVGADDYIPKPYTPDQIYDALDQALAWRQQITSPRVAGTVLLDSRDDGETLRRLGQLRSLLLARSALGLDRVAKIGMAIKEIWAWADQWARGQRLDRVATLTYELISERLTLTFRDEAGWLEAYRALAEDDSTSLLATAHFDQVLTDSINRCLTLVIHLLGELTTDSPGD